MKRAHLRAAACERATRVTEVRGRGASTGRNRGRWRRRGSRSGRRGRAGRVGVKRAAARGGATRQAPHPVARASPDVCTPPRRLALPSRPGGGGWVTSCPPTHPLARETRGRMGQQARTQPPFPHQPTALSPLCTRPSTANDGPAPDGSWATLRGEIGGNPGGLGGTNWVSRQVLHDDGGRTRDS